MNLYDRIGSGYDITRRADPYIAGRLLYHLDPGTREKFLDLACGSGNYTIALNQLGIDITGLDISIIMLQQALGKNPRGHWIMGDAGVLPFDDRSFAGVVCVLAIHHLSDLAGALKEVYRVLSRGRLVIFTSTAEQMEGYWLKEYFPVAMQKSIQQMPSGNFIRESLVKAGFKTIAWERYLIRDDLEDFFLYSGKHHPEIYLDSKIRAGISTFTSLADAEEMQRGCLRLDADIRSGRILEVTESFQKSSSGDYVFVITEK